MKKVLFLYLAPKDMASFVKKDYEMLKKYFKVKLYYYRGKLRAYPDILRILWGILTTDINVSWFAYRQAYYAVLFSRIFRKKSIIIIGGFDVLKEHWPEKVIPKKVIKELKFTLQYATKLIAISKDTKKETLKHIDRRDIKVIYHGFDSKYFKSVAKKDNLVITVGYIKQVNLWRKGYETFVKAAEYLPDTPFSFIGNQLDNSIDYLRSIASPNVKFINDEKLLEYMQKARVYVQVSYHESFGCSIAEAMLCECVPVVTNRGSIPEVVGDTGYYVPYGDPKATAEAIKKALKNGEKGKEARERVKNLFPLQVREKELIDYINS